MYIFGLYPSEYGNWPAKVCFRHMSLLNLFIPICKLSSDGFLSCIQNFSPNPSRFPRAGGGFSFLHRLW